jgi:hypothetical protein
VDAPTSLVTEPNVSPVVIETEVFPAATVESEAASRLGAKNGTTGRTIPVIPSRRGVIQRNADWHTGCIQSAIRF